MSEAEIAWLAGLFDGEGHIGIRTQLSQRCRGVKIQITNTHRPLLDRVQEVTGIGYITERPFPAPSRRQRTYDWHTTGGNAKTLLRLMAPWLLVKHAQALAALAD